ncbi:MAG: endonuclease/exonuclease/phosphatase family protein [Opitutaceae bacterium]|nr:endonuclease/exonuclease/phosphatase family protein [Opitutaceae bacterium]
MMLLPTPPATTRSTLAGMARAAFWTLTTIALPGSLLSTWAYFSSSPAFLAQLSPFRVQYAALLAAYALLCLALRRPRWALVFCAFAAFNTWAVLRPSWSDQHPARSGLVAYAAPLDAPPDATAGAPLKILFANILSSNSSPERLLALIAAEQPDLIALLEVNARWRAQLESALGAAYPFAFYKNREDNFGLAVLSRRPPLSGRVEYFADVETPSFDFNLEHGDRHLRILLTHPLPPGDTASTTLRDQHLDDLANWMRFVSELTPAGSPTPVLLLGDFNATPWCPPLRRLLAAGGLRPAALGHAALPVTWPVPIPFLRVPLDHALLNPALVCTSYRVGPDIGSDHYPVLLEIQIARQAAPSR